MRAPSNFRRPDNCTKCIFFDCDLCILYDYGWGNIDPWDRICDDFRKDDINE